MPVAILTLARPDKANAKTQAMAAALHRACGRADSDPSDRDRKSDLAQTVF
jgi:enoyl-CoA hydratase/carnithine racemase